MLSRYSRLPQFCLRRGSTTPFGEHVSQLLRKQHVPVHIMRRSVASIDTVQDELQSLCDSILCFANNNPTVTGAERLLKRARRDLASATALIGQGHQFASFADTDVGNQLQGARNNLRGLCAELEVAQQATGVVCLGARFYSQVSAGMSFTHKLAGVAASIPDLQNTRLAEF